MVYMRIKTEREGEEKKRKREILYADFFAIKQ